MSQATRETTTTEMVSTDRMALAVTGLEPESALAIRAAFEEMFASAETWAASARLIRVTSIDQKREMRMARESRLALRDIRVRAEHARKRLKEDSTRRGKAIDGIKAVLDSLIVPIEAHLLEQETFAERAEAADRAALKAAREEALRAYGADPSIYANLGATDEATWTITLDGARAAHEARLEAAKVAEAVKLEAERLAAAAREAKRLEAVRLEAERVERERMQLEENARLAKEKAEIEARAAAEREAAEAKAREVAAAAKAEREAADAALAVERAAAAAREESAKAEAQRVAAELAAVQAEAAAREEAAKAEAWQAAEAAKEAALAPDREKLLAYAAAVRAIPAPTLTSDRGRLAAGKVNDQLVKFAGWIEKTAGAL
ncbi:MAG: hypothetical protein JWP97_5740 [Labilithrix sp.]|nr:hypothetical protein [Labilithrix sp.]